MIENMSSCPVCLTIILAMAILIVIATVVELWVGKNEKDNCPRCGSHWHTDCNDP